jgi:hypothetical protein
MPILYNCRHDGDQYRITKFDDDMNPQASYLCTEDECECPAGVRPTCRHRAMLPKFIFRQHVGDEWFFDYDRGGWVQLGEEWARQTETQTIIYTTDEPPLEITHVELFVDAPQDAPTYIKRRF